MLEENTNIKNIDALHPTLEVYDETRGTVTMQYASIILEPHVGCNTEDPPLPLVYNIVKKEVDKITFKYNLDNWILKYCMRIDLVNNNCYRGGNPCILLNMPYATYDIDQARELLISYCTELMGLLKLKYAVLYFDIKNAYGISCIYDEEDNMIQSNVDDYSLENSVSCTINTGILAASMELQNTLVRAEEARDPNYYIIPLYLYTISYPTTSNNTLLTTAMIQNHTNFSEPTKFKKSVKKILDDSMLSFTNLTIL